MLNISNNIFFEKKWMWLYNKYSLWLKFIVEDDKSFFFSKLQFSRSVMSSSLRPHGLKHARPSCPSPTPGVYSNYVHWVGDAFNHLIFCRPLILLSSIFSSIGCFQMSQFFVLGSWGIEVSASTTVLSMNIQDWFPLGWTGWISLHSKELSRVFFNTTVPKHQFFCA